MGSDAIRRIIPPGATSWNSRQPANLQPDNLITCSFPVHCRSYSPLLTRFSTVKPAFLASETETVFGELKADHAFRTGFLQAGHWVNGAAESGRNKVNLPPHTLQSPSQSSYS
jgi:hypothetical protein